LFRKDLYYRVNVMKLALPPLNRRKEDIPLLVDHFVNRFNMLRGKDISGISEETMAVLMLHDFPGNVRELENIIEHAFILCKSGLIKTGHLPPSLQAVKIPLTLEGFTLAEMESRLIYEALVRNNWKRQATASELGINKSTLWRRLKQLKEYGYDVGRL